MRITLISALFFACCFSQCFAQKEGNIWYFGEGIIMDFNSGVPHLSYGGNIDTGIIGCCFFPAEGCSSISDSCGNLLFYSNGEKIWNRFDKLMPNGDSIMGGFSSTQAALIVPQPGNNNLYYVFTTDQYQNNLTKGFRYSIVDISLDNNNGDIINSFKNIKLVDTVAEKLTACRHANGTSYWILVHKFYSDAFYAFQLDSSGISVPIITHVGSFHPSSAGLYEAVGQMKISPDGKRIAVLKTNSTNNLEIFDFDNSTGVVSNPISIPANSPYLEYSVSFSPNSKVLYKMGTLNNSEFGITQYDISLDSMSQIISSSVNLVSPNCYGYTMQLGPDGKIYFSNCVKNTIGVINNPNTIGVGCNLVDSIFPVNVNNFDGYSLTSFIESYDYEKKSSLCLETGDDNIKEKHTLEVLPNPTSNFIKIIMPELQNKPSNIITIYNCLGEKMLKINFTNPAQDIDISMLPSGLYFIELQGKTIFVSRFIKI